MFAFKNSRAATAMYFDCNTIIKIHSKIHKFIYFIATICIYVLVMPTHHRNLHQHQTHIQLQFLFHSAILVFYSFIHFNLIQFSLINLYNKLVQIGKQQLMSSADRIKVAKSVLPSILKHGAGQIMLQSSIRPQVKATTASCIRVLKQVAYSNKVVSLAANQIGLEERVFVALKPQLIKAGKWRNYQNEFQKMGITQAEDAYEAIISVVETNSSYENYYAFQQCPSHPGLKFKIKIPLLVNVKYVAEKVLMDYLRTNIPASHNFKSIIDVPQQLYTQEKLVGFRGRVWDHQIRHLQGVLPIDDKVCGGQFYLLDDYKNSIQNLEYYENLKDIQKKFEDKNLKKIQKQKKKELQNKSKGKNKQINKIDRSSLNFMDSVKQTLKEDLNIPNMKNKQMKKVNKNEKNAQQIYNKNFQANKKTTKK